MKPDPLTLLATGGHAGPSTSVTLLFAALLAAMIACLALEEKLHARKSIIVGMFALVCLLLGEVFGLIHRETVTLLGQEVDMPVYIPAVDWEVIAIIVGSSLFVDATSRTGLFNWIAVRLTRLSRGDPLVLLWFYGLMTVVFSAVLNNVTAMVIVGSLTGVSLKKLRREQLLPGFLLAMGLLTNIGGLLTLISSVPNIIVGTRAGISFAAFFVKAAPYVAVATAGTLLLAARLFRIRRLRDPAARAEAAALVSGFDEREGIESPAVFWFGAIMLGAFIAVIATTSLIPYVRDLGMGFVALAFAGVMLLRHRHEVNRFYSALDWDLMAFFTSLFVVINVMEHAQVLALIGRGLEHLVALGDTAGPAALLVASSAASAVTDNIPLAAMLAKVLAALPGIGDDPASPFWWAVIFGANLGGNLTPIGSASTLVAVTFIHRHGIRLTFAEFVKKAMPFAVLQVALAILYVLLVLPMLPM